MFSHDEENIISSEQPNLAPALEVFVPLFVAMMLLAGVVGAVLPDGPPSVTDETRPPDVVYARVLVTGGDRILLDGQEVAEEELVAKLLECQSQSQGDGTVLIGQSADADKFYFYDIRIVLRNAGLHYAEAPPARETS